MKIELKHIVPYLPYGLKGIEKSYKVIMELHGASQHGFTLEDGDYDDIRRFKPILRPLSDLTLEDCMAYDISNAMSVLCGQSSEYILKHTSYKDIQTLISLHFDVFGLIEQGLAIDIKTLEK